MAVTTAANTIILNAVIAETFYKIDRIVVKDGSGSILETKTATDITESSTTQRIYTFYLNESEAVGTIASVELRDSSGNIYCTQSYAATKNSTQSLTFQWTLIIN